ncbi:MAG: diacylglycerol kinase family lipid kinase [Pedosphaera sp.]|nr:diacylglycerol kinase family lipid kinase [Pedosphaera sp.]
MRLVRTCVIFNPSARGDKARHFRSHLNELAREADLRATEAPGDAIRLTARAIQEGFEVVVAAGGDGTVNEVVSGFMEAGDASARARLGVIPLGTVNVFARELAIPSETTAAWRVIHSSRERLIDLPLADFEHNGGRRIRAFAQLAGAGLDALAIERVSWKWKKRVGSLAYIVAGLHAMLASRSGKIHVEADDKSAVGQFVAIGNGRLYGPGFEFFPGASMTDGMIDVAVFPRVGWLSLAWCGLHLLTRRRLPHGSVIQLRAREVRLSSATRTPFELDGDLIGELPATFRMAKQKLRVSVP